MWSSECEINCSLDHISLMDIALNTIWKFYYIMMVYDLPNTFERIQS